jgi:hypothetical protein
MENDNLSFKSTGFNLYIERKERNYHIMCMKILRLTVLGQNDTSKLTYGANSLLNIVRVRLISYEIVEYLHEKMKDQPKIHLI